MMPRHHLHDQRLLDCYVAERAGEALDPPEAEHLADCPDCALRYAEFAGFMDQVKADATEEADEIFTPERLAVQQASIVRRLELTGRAARVITFPGRLVARHMSPGGSRIAPRWLAAAAAAGLLIGVGAGQFFYGVRTPQPRAVAIGAAGAGSAAGPASAISQVNPVNSIPSATRSLPAEPPADTSDGVDDDFLAHLELAVQRPRTRELLAFDAMTPHAREISVRVR
jgi:hypothetical protein